MQVLSSLRSAKNRHPDCKVVRRRGRIYVICKAIRDSKRYRDVRKSVNSKVSSVAKPRCCSTGFYGENVPQAVPAGRRGGDYLMLLSSASTLCLNACS